MTNPIVIIEADSHYTNMPNTVNNYSVWEAAEGKGLPWKLVSYDQLEIYLSLEEIKNAIPSGSIKFVNWFFKARGLSYPPALDYPTELLPYLNRQVLRTTLSTLLASWGPSGPSSPLFIKPATRSKAFTGFVLQPEGWVKQLSDIDPNQEVWTSEVIEDIQSEWRVFVLDKKILDIRPYRQTFKGYSPMPSAGIVEMMIRKFVSAPRAYSLDVGVKVNKKWYDEWMETDHHKEYLIEVNDSLALGSYGLDSYKYLDMLIARWEETRCQHQ